MPPLTGFPDRINADQQWLGQFATAQAQAARVATILHVIHVTGRTELVEGSISDPKQKPRIQFDTILSNDHGQIPLSRATHGNQVYCGEGAIFVENTLVRAGLPCPPAGVIYCYAGRALPSYGKVAMAFQWMPDEEKERVLWATPYDTGGMVKDPNWAADAFPLRDIPGKDLDRRVQYLRETLDEIPTGEWRDKFALWLAAYFGTDAAGYWTRSPERDDPDGLYSPTPSGKRNWTAWTWEVLLKVRVHVNECEWWCADQNSTLVTRRLAKDLAADERPEAGRQFGEFLGKDLSAAAGVVGYEKYDVVLETRVRQHALANGNSAGRP